MLLSNTTGTLVATLKSFMDTWKNFPPSWVDSDPCDDCEEIKCKNTCVTSMYSLFGICSVVAPFSLTNKIILLILPQSLIISPLGQKNLSLFISLFSIYKMY